MPVWMRVALCAACGLLAAALVAVYAGSVRAQASATRQEALARYGGETAQVCVATRAIAAGEVFTERNVAMQEWLVDLLPEGAATDAQALLGQVAAVSVPLNAVVCAAYIDAGGEDLEVPADLTAVTLPCSAQTAVGGALAKGSRPDIYVIADGGASRIAENVLVLQTSSTSGSALTWVTVAVEPALVEQLIAASSLQRLYFSLPASQPQEAL